MLSICIIKNNEITFPQLNVETCTETNEEIIKLCESHTEICRFETTDNSSIYRKIVEIINMGKNDVGDTKIIYDNENYSYQMCFISSDNEERGKLNIFGMYLGKYALDGNHKIRGNCVVLKYDINARKIIDFEAGDMSRIVVNHFVHKGIKINVDGTFDTFKYFCHPLEWINGCDRDKYLCCQTELFDKKINFFVKKNETNALNEQASSMLNNKNIYEDCYIVLSNDFRFFDLNEDMYIKLRMIMSDGTVIRDEEKNYDFELGQSTRNIMNFDMFINSKFKEVSNGQPSDYYRKKYDINNEILNKANVDGKT